VHSFGNEADFVAHATLSAPGVDLFLYRKPGDRLARPAEPAPR
jgi:hypothetical protein